MDKTLAIVLAGGRGTRLEPLTRDRAKPAVPFGGSYRIVDFTLSNCLNSGLKKLLILTQYKSLSLDRHIDLAWKGLFLRDLGRSLDVVPPQQRITDDWYLGTADAVYQNIYSIERESPDYVLVLAGDHIYKMDYARILGFHRERRADVTVATLRVPVETAARQFGVIQVDDEWNIQGFEEKPDRPKPIPGDAEYCLASMGIYVFSTQFLIEQLCSNALAPNAGHDFGHHILPALVGQCSMRAFAYSGTGATHVPYWRDVGTLDAYYDCNMDLLVAEPPLNLYDAHWPIRTFKPVLPPPMLDVRPARDGGGRDVPPHSIVCSGTIVSGGGISGSILGYNCRIESDATIEGSILMDRAVVGRGARIRRAILDKDVQISPGSSIGFDADADRRRGCAVTENHVTVVPRNHTA